jgi:hypothetical protein
VAKAKNARFFNSEDLRLTPQEAAKVLDTYDTLCELWTQVRGLAASLEGVAIALGRIGLQLRRRSVSARERHTPGPEGRKTRRMPGNLE